MTAGFSVVTRFHPDTLQVPGDPDRLRRGADSLQELATELTDIGSRLRDAHAPQETRGPTVRAMSRVAGTLGKVLQADADQLSDLAELTRHQSERLAEAQELVEESRRRWRDARQELRAQIGDLNEMAARAERERVQERERRQERARREGKDDRAEHDRDDRPDPEPPTEASQLIRAMDQQVLDRFEVPLRRLAGLEFTERNGASAMLTNGKVEQAASATARSSTRSSRSSSSPCAASTDSTSSSSSSSPASRRRSCPPPPARASSRRTRPGSPCRTTSPRSARSCRTARGPCARPVSDGPTSA